MTRGGGITSTVNYEELANILNDRMVNREGGQNQRLAIMLGMLTNDTKHPIRANIPETDRSMFSQEKYKFLLDAPFEISQKCCGVMKKSPAHTYARQTGRKPITAQMASESRIRTQKWIQKGCNAFDNEYPISNPMSFWLENDVLEYIKQNGLRIASVYGDVVEDFEKEGQIDGQISLEEFGLMEKPKCYKTTGCKRTGCVFCLYGIHLEKSPNRLERLKVTHPKLYDYVMRPEEEGGLGYKWKIDWINEHGNMNIKY